MTIMSSIISPDHITQLVTTYKVLTGGASHVIIRPVQVGTVNVKGSQQIRITQQ